MAQDNGWQGFLKSAEQAAVVCFAGEDEYLVLRRAAALTQHLQSLWQDSELTRIAGEDFTLEEAVLAAGTISFFATKRIVRIDRFAPAALSDADMREFCELIRDTENAVFIVSVVYKNAKEGATKRMRAWKDAVQLYGCWQDVALPPGGARAMAGRMAQGLGAAMTDAAAAEIVRRTGDDLYLLSAEVEKLAAGAGYGTITPDTVAALAVRTVEADVFKMVDAVQAGRSAAAFEILDKLLYLRSEPIAIAGALASSFVNMARAAVGAAHGVGYAGVYKALGYTGSDYPLKVAARTAARFSPAQLRSALQVLVRLDADLKSSPLDDAVLLQTALGELCDLVRRR